MALLLTTTLILAILTGCVLLAVAANLLSERYARHRSVAALISSAEALLRDSAAHRAGSP